MTIEGSLRTMPAKDLLEWILTRKVSGRLAVRRDKVLRTFETDGASITWVSSNRPADVLSQVLRSRKHIDAEGLERAASMEVASGVMLGQALIESGVLSEAKVLEVLDSQIREAALDILSWNRGGFRFVPEVSDRRSRLSIAVPITELLDIGRALTADWSQLRATAPSLETEFWLKNELDSAKLADSPASLARHKSIVDALEDDPSFGAIIAKAAAERFVTTADLAVLLNREVIGVVPRAPGATKATEAIEYAAAARAAHAADEFLDAYDFAREATAIEPESQELATLAAELKHALACHLSRTLLGSHRIPRRIASADELSGTNLSADERYAFDRIDGVWDLFSLVTSSALGELTSLVTYKQLDERGLISL